MEDVSSNAYYSTAVLYLDISWHRYCRADQVEYSWFMTNRWYVFRSIKINGTNSKKMNTLTRWETYAVLSKNPPKTQYPLSRLGTFCQLANLACVQRPKASWREPWGTIELHRISLYIISIFHNHNGIISHFYLFWTKVRFDCSVIWSLLYICAIRCFKVGAICKFFGTIFVLAHL